MPRGLTVHHPPALSSCCDRDLQASYSQPNLPSFKVHQVVAQDHWRMGAEDGVESWELFREGAQQDLGWRPR